jgi:hypothetical protein
MNSCIILRFPEPCWAQEPLDQALEYLNRGDKKRAGEKLLESLTEFLRASCEHERCLPRIKRNRTAVGMINAMNRRGKMGGSSFRWCLDILEGANLAVDGKQVESDFLKTSIRLLEALFDGSDGLSWPTVPTRRACYVEG